MGSRLRSVVGPAVLLVALVGCGDSTTDVAVEPTPATSSAGGPGSAPAKLQLRVVESVAPGGGLPCPAAATAVPEAAEPATVCDTEGNRFRVEPAAWEGVVDAAEPEVPDLQVDWVLNVDLPRDGAVALRSLSSEFAGTGTQVAIVLEGVVLSAAVFSAVIIDGKFQLGGGFTEADANSLADRLVGR